MDFSTITVAMFAGTSNSGWDKWPELPAEGKSHAMIAGKSMVDWTCDKFKEAGLSPQVEIAEWIKKDHQVDGCYYMTGTGNLVTNLWKVLDYLSDKGDRVLLATCDIPAVTSAGLSDFVAQALRLDADVVVPVIDASLCQQAFPGANPTTWKCSGTTVTMGNVMLVKTSPLQANRELVEEVIRGKKDVKVLVSMLGIPFVMRFALTRLLGSWCLPIEVIERTIFNKFEISIKAIHVNDPGLGIDIDNETRRQVVEQSLLLQPR